MLTALRFRGELGFRVLRNSNWIFNTSYFIPNKVLKNPTTAVPSSLRICRISSFVCFHQVLVWKECKERFCREVPNRAALKQLKSNQTLGLVLWELLLGIQCHPQRHPKLLAGSVPSPHARSSQAVPPQPCVHAGSSRQGTQFHGLSFPAGTP